MKRVYLIFLTLIPYNNIRISPRVFISRSKIMFEIMRFFIRLRNRSSFSLYKHMDGDTYIM